jgi:hypothetical protein
MLCEDDEGTQQGIGLAIEKTGLTCLDQVAAQLEILIDRQRRIADRKQPDTHRLDEDVIGTLHQLGGAVVVLHQPLVGAQVGGGGQIHSRGEFVLVIECQAILAPPGQKMQLDAQAGQPAFLAGDALGLGRCQQSRACQPAPAAGDGAGLCHPLDGVQVAQTARTVLEIGLQLVSAVVESLVACVLLGELAVEKTPRIEARLETAAELCKQALIAPQIACLEQVGLDRDVLARLAHAGVDAAHAVADFQADVPAGLHPALQCSLLGAVRIIRQQQQNVDV